MHPQLLQEITKTKGIFHFILVLSMQCNAGKMGL